MKARLQREVDGLPGGFEMKDVQELDYLQCVINETLRLYGSVSGSLPRMTPNGGKEVGGYFVPEGVIVSTQSFTFHRDEAVFVGLRRLVSTYRLFEGLCMLTSYQVFSGTMEMSDARNERSVHAIWYPGSWFVLFSSFETFMARINRANFRTACIGMQLA